MHVLHYIREGHNMCITLCKSAAMHVLHYIREGHNMCITPQAHYVGLSGFSQRAGMILLESTKTCHSEHQNSVALYVPGAEQF